MSARDELEALILSEFHPGATGGSTWRLNPSSAADKILAAGYRKPRTITTAEELHELQDGSAVSADGDVHIKNGRWVDRLGEFSPAWLLLEMGTVTVLYEPTV